MSQNIISICNNAEERQKEIKAIKKIKAAYGRQRLFSFYVYRGRIITSEHFRLIKVWSAFYNLKKLDAVLNKSRDLLKDELKQIEYLSECEFNTKKEIKECFKAIKKTSKEIKCIKNFIAEYREQNKKYNEEFKFFENINCDEVVDYNIKSGDIFKF